MFVPTRLAVGTWLMLGLVACGADGGGSGFTSPTYVSVDPAEFTQRVECHAGGSAVDASAADAGSPSARLQSYAAVLLRVEVEKGRTSYRPVATSAATSCRSGVRFKVQTNTLELARAQYAADLFGFELPASEIEAPEGGPAAVAAAFGAEATWLGSCGRGQIDTAAPGDAGRLSYPVSEGALQSDSGVIDALFGPKRAVSGRTITLRGCSLAETN